MRRLLVYSQDGMGLGHLRRAYNIVAALLSRTPGLRVLIVGDSPAIPYFSALPGVDYVKLPTIVKKGSSRWHAGPLGVRVLELVRLRAKLILETYEAFRPDTVLVDHMPVGALGELKPLLEAVGGRVRRPRLFLGLRDVLDSPAVIRRVWAEQGAYEYLERYKAVLIYGCRHIYDAATLYGLTEYTKRLYYCNYAAPPAALALAGGLTVGGPLVVMGGGGADSFPLAETFVAAFPLLRWTGLRAVVLTGPNMLPPERQALTAKAAGYPIEITSGWTEATTYVRASSAVLTMGGYNSFCEVLAAQKKALVVPRPGPSAEQRIRSSLFAERGLVNVLDPNDLEPERLAGELVHLLEQSGVPAIDEIPPLDGAERAAALIADGLVPDEIEVLAGCT